MRNRKGRGLEIKIDGKDKRENQQEQSGKDSNLLLSSRGAAGLRGRPSRIARLATVAGRVLISGGLSVVGDIVTG